MAAGPTLGRDQGRSKFIGENDKRPMPGMNCLLLTFPMSLTCPGHITARFLVPPVATLSSPVRSNVDKMIGQHDPRHFDLLDLLSGILLTVPTTEDTMHRHTAIVSTPWYALSCFRVLVYPAVPLQSTPIHCSQCQSTPLLLFTDCRSCICCANHRNSKNCTQQKGSSLAS